MKRRKSRAEIIEENRASAQLLKEKMQSLKETAQHEQAVAVQKQAQFFEK